VVNGTNDEMKAAHALSSVHDSSFIIHHSSFSAQFITLGGWKMDTDFKLNKVGVVMVGVRDLASSVVFYRDKLGLTLVSQFEGFAFFNGGGVTLALSEGLARAHCPSGPVAGATEVVFSVDDVRAAYQELAERGVSFTHEPRVVSGPMWAANFNDPDGHRLSAFGPERKV
jgi:methylmalonyl-CoA/ethylmalonyl-CoA epimerase